MPQIGTWLLAHIFTALLPPLGDEDDHDYYDILDISRNATNEQIRKAYRKQSLKLHPDKIAQRRETNPEEAREKYEQVQEAYGVLVNDNKRQRYHALQCSPKRYRFVNQGALASPGALYENLTNASTMDKTRLVVLCTLIVLVVFVEPILVASKVNHIVEDEGGGLKSANWILLLIPTWIIGALWILFHFLLLALAPIEAKLSVFGSLIEYLLWFAGAILLALKWDKSISSSYAQAFIPFYLAMGMRWIFQSLLLLQIRRDVGRMVTPDHLEKNILNGTSLEEISDEEKEKLKKTYLVVTVPEDFEPMEVEATAEGEELYIDEVIEIQKVEASPEYEAAMDLYFTTMGKLVGSLIFGLVFMVVLTLKLDRKIDANYWVVFIPVWIHHGSRWIYYCFQCACATVSGEEIILQMQEQQQEEGQGEQGEETKEGDEEEGNTNTATTGSGGKSPNGHPKNRHFVSAEDRFSKVNASKSRHSEASSKSKTSSKTTEGPAEKSKEEPTGNEEDKKEEITPRKDGTKEENKAGGNDDADTNANTTTNANGDDDDGGDEVDHIHIDEETFHAWQNAYEEAERGAMEQQAKASVECCNLSVQLMVLILVVAKIDNSYWNSNNPSDPGFNTFWILFPFFLFFGLILCCCACLIYGAEPGKASDMQENDVGESEQTQERSDNPVLGMQPRHEEQSQQDESLRDEQTQSDAPDPSPLELPAEQPDIEHGSNKEESSSKPPVMDDLD